MRLDTLLARASDQTLHALLSGPAMRLLMQLGPSVANPVKLREIACELHTPEGMLLSPELRNVLFDLLRPKEAQQLAVLLGYSSSGDVYNRLKASRIPRNSSRERALFDFFELNVPLPEDNVETPAAVLVAPNYSLFEHQRRAVCEVRELLYEGTRRVLLHMPTGAGKTRTAMNLIAEHFRGVEPTLVIWLAYSEELCEQAAGEFERAWNALGNRELTLYRFWGSRELDPYTAKDGFLVAGLSKFYSATKQNIAFISTLASKCSLVIIDEAHMAVAETYQTVLDALVVQRPTTSLLGLTATPGRTWLDLDEDFRLSNFFSRKKVELIIPGYSNPIDYLVDQGYLAKTNFRPLLHDGGFELSQEDIHRLQTELDIPATILKKLADDEMRNLVIVRTLEQLIEQHNRILVFATTVDHSELLATVLRARGIHASSVTGSTPTHKRARLIADFQDNDPTPKILCNYGVLTTGFDAPKTSAAVIARPTTSLVLYSQMVGRATRGRRVGGNADAEVLTVIDRGLPGFGSVAEAFHNWQDVWD